MALIEVADLGKQYEGRRVLGGVDLAIERGEVFAVIGPTGSGKTTLLRLLDLLEAPTSGRICFDGTDVTHSQRHRLEARRRMAYVQQRPIAFAMSVFDNVACGLKWRRAEKEAVREKVERALELVGLAGKRGQAARTLSGGEMQRVAIARALVTDPEVLLLDEPTANLDPSSIAKVEEVLAHIIGEQRTTVLMATHDMPQGQRLAGRIGVLIEGELLQVGTPSEVFCSPQSTEVAQFVGVENILAGVITRREDDLVAIDVAGRELQAISGHAVGDRVYALIRPEDITFTLAREASSARNTFEGQIRRMTPLGPLVRLEVDCGLPLLGALTSRSAQEMGLAVGTQVFASFKATAVHVIG